MPGAFKIASAQKYVKSVLALFKFGTVLIFLLKIFERKLSYFIDSQIVEFVDSGRIMKESGVTFFFNPMPFRDPNAEILICT